MCITLSLYSQKKVELSFQQDARLLLFGDDKGNDPITFNILSRLEVPIKEFTKSYISTFASFEYADLNSLNYQRYGLGFGYILRNIYKKFGAGAYFDYGKIYRENRNFNSVSLSGELSYKLSDTFKLVCTQQIKSRRDLKALWNSDKNYVISGFLGIKFSF